MDLEKEWELNLEEMFWKEEEIVAENHSAHKWKTMDHRLKKKKQFAYIYKKGTRKSTRHLTLFTIPSKFSSYKIGYSVSKKIGKANVRNKVKRRLREIVRRSDFPKEYANYVLMAREGIELLSFDELKNQVKEIFSKNWKSFF